MIIIIITLITNSTIKDQHYVDHEQNNPGIVQGSSLV